MWMYSIVRMNVDWTHLTTMFVLRTNVAQMSKHMFGLLKEVSHKIIENWCRGIWDYIW